MFNPEDDKKINDALMNAVIVWRDDRFTEGDIAEKLGLHSNTYVKWIKHGDMPHNVQKLKYSLKVCGYELSVEVVKK